MAIALVLFLSAVTFVSLKGGRVLMTLFAIDLGAGPLLTGLLFAVYGIFPALLVVHAGRIADRIGNRVLMYVGFTGFACTLALPALVPTLPMLFIASPLIGVTSMIFIVATQNLVGGTVDAFGFSAAYYVRAAIAAACLVVLHFGRGHIPARSGVVDTGKRGP